MAKRKPNKGKTNRYALYKANNTYRKNRERTLQNHLEIFPDDEQAKRALGNIKYRRKKPTKVKGWVKHEGPTSREAAQTASQLRKYHNRVNHTLSKKDREAILSAKVSFKLKDMVVNRATRKDEYPVPV